MMVDMQKGYRYGRAQSSMVVLDGDTTEAELYRVVDRFDNKRENPAGGTDDKW